MSDRFAPLRKLLAPYGTVFAYAVDPGAAALLREVAAEATAGGKTVRWFAEGWAAEQGGLPHEPAECLPAALVAGGGGTVLLLGSQTNFTRTWNMLALSAASGVPSVFFFDHWKNYARHFVRDDNRPVVLPDIIALPDAPCRQGLEAALAAAGVPAAATRGRLRVLCHYAVAAAADRIAALAPARLAEAQEALNPTGKLLIAILLDPTEREPRDLGYDWRSALTAMRGYARRHHAGHRVLIKPHPRQDPETVRAAVEAWRATGLDAVLALAGTDILIALADAVWGMTSVALVTAQTVGKPILSFQGGRNALGAADSNPHIEPFTILDANWG